MRCFSIYLLLLLTFTNPIKAQKISINNGAHLLINGGSKLIIYSNLSLPIQKIGSIGGIFTSDENSGVLINTSNSSGQFTIPFVSSTGNTIPFTYNISTSGSSGGKIFFSTYETGNNNLPYPSGVTNVGFNGFDNSSMVVDRFWIIDAQGYSTKPKGTYTFTYDDNDLAGNTIYEPGLFMQRWNDSLNIWGDWLYSPTANTTANTISVIIANPEDQYKVWTAVDQGQPLPIELISFKANCDDNKIEWITASETNNELFILQGTNNGIIFFDLDTIPGAGNSNQLLYYSSELETWEYSYFRLQQKDFDGKFENSFIIKGCQQNKNLDPVIFPNPTSGRIIIKYNSHYLFEIFDMTGRKIWSEKSNRIDFDLTQFQDGEYLIRLTGQYDQVKTFKVIKNN